MAAKELGGALKFQVTLKPQPLAAVAAEEKKAKKKEKKAESVAATAAPDEKKKEKKAPKVKEEKKKKVKTTGGTEEDEIEEAPQKLRGRAKTIDQPQAEVQAVVDEETPSSDKDEEEEEKECQTVSKGKHCCNKSGALPPRKSLKKLILKELEKSAP